MTEHPADKTPPYPGRSAGSWRPGVPLLMLLALILTLLALWQASLWYRERLLAEERARQGGKLSLYGNALSVLLDRNLSRLDALHAFAMAAPPAEDLGKQFETFSAGLLSGARGIRNLALAPGGVIRYIYPLAGNERAMGHDLLHDPATREYAARAMMQRRMVLSPPYQLRQGGYGLVGRRAVYKEGAFWGLAAMALDLPFLFQAAGLESATGMQLALRDASGKLILGSAEVFSGNPLLQRIHLPDGYWVLAGIPSGGWDAAVQKPLLLFRINGLALGGLLLALLYSLLSRQEALTRAVRDRTALLARRNDELRQEIAARLEAETALRRSEEHLRDLFELIPMGLALCSWDGRLRELNPAFAGILGMSVPEALQSSYWEFTPEKYLEQEREILKLLERTGRYGPYEKEIIHKDGHLVPVRLQGLVINQEGESYIWSSVEDITKRKQLEDALRERNEQFSLFVEHSPAAIAMLDRDMRYLIASRRWLTDFHLTDQEVTGRSHHEVFPDLPQRWKEVHRRCLAGAVERSLEDRFERADGTVEWSRWEVRPWYLRSGEIGGIIIFSENITQRVLAEEALRRERDLSDLLIDSLPGVVYLHDQNLKFLRWNRNLERILGLRGEEIAAHSPLDFHAPKHREQVRAKIREIQVTGSSHLEAELVSREGGATPYYFTGLKTEISGATCLLWVGIDISARKALENELLLLNRNLEERVAERTRELQESRLALINMVEDLQETTEALHAANEKLLEVDRLKSMFIASMSHELRTPLNSVIGFTSVLLSEWVGPLNGEQKENLAIVLRAGRHLLSLINDVIDVSKIEAGQMELHRLDFDLFDLIAEATGIMQKELRDKGLELRVENLHQVMQTDRARLLQCLLNLLSNAIKYTEKGGITVRARRLSPGETAGVGAGTPLTAPGDVEIAVEDSGIGISETDQARLFQPFVRLDTPLRTAVTGTGLGLYLTRKIVQELLQGSVLCRSTPGAGSSFVLTLPVKNPKTVP